MTRRIFTAILFSTVGMLVAATLIVMTCFYGVYESDQEGRLVSELGLVAAAVEQSGQAYLDDVDPGNYRITWVAPDGDVIFDSQVPAVTLPNHADRPEIREAFESGTGAQSRYSSTLTQRTVYRAQVLDDGTVLRMSVSHATALALVHDALPPVLLLGCAAVALSALLARRMAKKIVEPLDDIDLDAPTPADGAYEELRPLLTRLEQQRVQLDERVRTRSEFTTNVSHELKTPLQSIIGSAELIETGLVTPEDLPRFVGHIHSEAARMVTLVEDIIRLSQLDEGVELNHEQVDLREVANEVVDSLQEVAGAKNVHLFVADPQGDPVTVTGVRGLFHEVIYNLCDNAIKYNREGGEIEVTVAAGPARIPSQLAGAPTAVAVEGEHPQGAGVCVRDTGIGIAPEHMGRVFERFFRVDKSHSRASGGTGLGLSIVKHAVQYHRGQVEVASLPDVGTAITVLV